MVRNPRKIGPPGLGISLRRGHARALELFDCPVHFKIDPDALLIGPGLVEAVTGHFAAHPGELSVTSSADVGRCRPMSGDVGRRRYGTNRPSPPSTLDPRLDVRGTVLHGESTRSDLPSAGSSRWCPRSSALPGRSSRMERSAPLRPQARDSQFSGRRRDRRGAREAQRTERLEHRPRGAGDEDGRRRVPACLQRPARHRHRRPGRRRRRGRQRRQRHAAPAPDAGATPGPIRATPETLRRPPRALLFARGASPVGRGVDNSPATSQRPPLAAPAPR